MKQKRIAIYVRVSTEGQADEGYSISAQIANLKSINTSLGHIIIDEYIDRGISGKSMENRPALLMMLEDAKKRLFDEIVVWKLNRLARNHIDLLKIHEILEGCGVTFRSVTEPFDTSNPAGKLLFNLLGSIGEFERETIVENVKSGMKQRALQGHFNGGKMLGYRSKTVEDSQEKSKLVIVPDEAEIIKIIYGLYANGKGYKHIANRLNEMNYKTLKGNNFSLNAIRDIVMNPTYGGKISYNRRVNFAKKARKGNDNEFVIVDGHHEPIVDKETFNKVREKIDYHRERERKIYKGVMILTGILRCPECGSSMVAGRASRTDKHGEKKVWKYYQCSRFKRFGKAECSSNSIRSDYAEEFILNYLSEFSFNDELIESIVSDINKHVDNKILPLKSRIDQVILDKEAQKSKKDRLLSLYEDNLIDQSILKERLSKIDIKIAELSEIKYNLQSELKQSNVTTEIPVDRVKKLLKNFGSILSISSREQKKILLNLVIDKITTDNDRKIDKIYLSFSNLIQKRLLDEDSSDEESSIFMPFSIRIK